MRIKLKNDWDFFPKIDEAVGHFTGRKDVKERLVNEIARRSNGAILVSGSRGVGKTALVYESIRTLNQDILGLLNRTVGWIKEIKIFIKKSFPFVKIELVDNKTTILPVLINASQLDLNSKAENDNSRARTIRKEILVNLIRALYTTLEKNNYSKKIAEALYQKALATEYKISKESVTSHTLEYGFYGSINTNTVNLFNIALAIFLLSLLPYIIYKFINLSDLIKTILSILSDVVILFAIKYSDNFLKSNTEKEIYLRDDTSVTNLEIELEEVLEKLSRFIKPVFVIDELDYLETLNLTPESDIGIIRLVKTYKNLFNLSDAIFIFIAGDETWKSMRSSGRKGVQHTIFTSQIFLNKPDFSDIKNYIKDISLEPRKWNANEGQVNLSYIVFRSKSEYYDLKNFIANHVKEFLPDKTPILQLEKDTPIIIRQSKLQEVIEALYDYQKNPDLENNDKNYSLLESIYTVSDKISNKEIFIVKKWANKWELDENNDQVEDLGDWFINLINSLEWLNLVENFYEQEVVVDPNTPDKKFTLVSYRWTGKSPKVPKKISRIVTREKVNFKNHFEDLLIRILRILNTFSYINKASKFVPKSVDEKIDKDELNLVSEISGLSLMTFYDEQRSFLEGLYSGIPSYVNASEINNHTKSVAEFIGQIIKNTSRTLANMLVKIISSKGDVPELLTSNDHLDLISSYPQLTEIVGSNNGYFVKRQNGKKLLICEDLDLNKLDKVPTSYIKRDNVLRMINLTNNIPNVKTKKTVNQILINIRKEEFVDETLWTESYKNSLKKVSQFLRWYLS